MCPAAGTGLYTETQLVSDPLNPATKYKGEATAASVILAVTRGVYSPSVAYKVGEVVGASQDLLATIGGVPNPYYGYIMGPFFRALRSVPASAASTLPTTTIAAGAYLPDTAAAPVSNTYWTTADIPTQVQWADARLAGVNGWKASLCKTVALPGGGTYRFCPPLCATQCSKGDPSTAEGLYEPEYEFTSSTASDGTVTRTVTAALCMPRCGVSAYWSGSGKYCISRNFVTDKPVYPPYSDCANGTVPLRTTPTNPASAQCFTPCDGDAGMEIRADGEYKTCISKCPLHEGFVDSGDVCVKVAYERAGVNSTASSLTAQQAALEEQFGATATTVSKVALWGGTGSLVQVAGVAVGVCLLVALVLLATKRASVVAGMR